MAAAAVVVVVAALVGDGGSASSAGSTSPGAEGESAAAVEASAPATVPDVLPDPGVAPGTCEVLSYTPEGSEERQEGELCRPAEDQRDVAVVLLHGGGGIEGSPASVRSWATRLNLEGYVTFAPAYHLFSPGSGEQPVFPAPEQDAKAAVQRLRGSANALGIRRDRIAVQGHSAGARIGAVAFATPDHPAFVGPELHAGVSDRVDAFVGFYHPYDGTMQHASQYYGGSDASQDPAVRSRWDLADAIAGAGRADAPALLVTGSEDWALIDEQQEQLAEALRLDGQLARTVVIDGGGHGFDLGGSRLTRLGEEAALEVLTFLNDAFPQDPQRPAASAEIDLSKAPRGTGSPATSLPTRTRRSPSVGSGSGSGSGQSSDGGGWSPSSSTSSPAPAAPETTAAPPPPSSEPAPTTAPPPPPSAPTTTPSSVTAPPSSTPTSTP